MYANSTPKVGEKTVLFIFVNFGCAKLEYFVE